MRDNTEPDNTERDHAEDAMEKTPFRVFTTMLVMALVGITIAKSISYYETKSVNALVAEDWGLGFSENGKAPTANTTPEELKQYNGYYIGDQTKKVIYLTFDCGYENGNMPQILDALKACDVKAAFFVVGNYLETDPELVKRMVTEGHIVGNHSYHHPDMSSMDREGFEKELNSLSEKYKEVTGQEMQKYYRPPQGKYSLNSVKMADELGYKTVFWSLAYVDWYDNDQPTKEQAYEKLLGRIHPGAVVLLHATSKTNADILQELIAKWKEMGYSFETIDKL